MPDYQVGDRVVVRAGDAHDEMTADVAGTVVIIGTPALGVMFDGMTKVHKWYVADEVEPEGQDGMKSAIRDLTEILTGLSRSIRRNK